MSGDDTQRIKERARKVVKKLKLTERGYMGEEYFVNEFVAFASSERDAATEQCCKDECIYCRTSAPRKCVAHEVKA